MESCIALSHCEDFIAAIAFHLFATANNTLDYPDMSTVIFAVLLSEGLKSGSKCCGPRFLKALKPDPHKSNVAWKADVLDGSSARSADRLAGSADIALRCVEITGRTALVHRFANSLTRGGTRLQGSGLRCTDVRKQVCVAQVSKANGL